MPVKKTKATKPKRRIVSLKAPVPTHRLLEITNTSSSDFELIVNDVNGISIVWMTPQKRIFVPNKPQTPQLEEYKRRQMVSVTEVQR